MKPTLPAFILGVEHPRGIACVRSLARKNIAVVCVDHRFSSSGMPYSSRYAKKRLNIDPDSRDAIQRLEEYNRGQGGVLIPTNDEYLIFVAKNHQRLSSGFQLCSPTWDQLHPVMDRVRSSEMAQSVGIPTPMIYAPKDRNQLEQVLEQLDFSQYRYVLKLEIWTDATADTRLKRKTTYGGANADELRNRMLEIVQRTGEYPTIQELIPGETDMSIGVSMVVDQKGEISMPYCVRRLKLQTYSQVDDYRHPYDLGGNVFCETIHDPEAIALAQKLVGALDWIGAITVEFRRDARDGSLTFVKFDPRVIRSTTLAAAIGMDIPYTIYQIALGIYLEKYGDFVYPQGICWVWIDTFIHSLWTNRKQNSVRWELIGLFKRWRSIRAFAYWDIRDPLPFFIQIFLRLTLARKWIRPKRISELRILGIGLQKPVKSE